MEKEPLEAFLKVMPVLKDMLLEDIGVCVTDTETVLYYRPADALDSVTINVGDKLQDDDPLRKAMEKGDTVSSIVPKETYGITFKSISYPIKDSDGTVIGGVGLSKSLEKQSRIEDSAKSLFSSLEQTSSSIQEISTGSEKLNNVIGSIAETTKQTEKHVAESNEIIDMIQSMAKKSNLLGLNAAIEAARSGEQGRGFSVVASEMRKLAQLSSESSKKVSRVLSEISNDMGKIVNIINEAQTVSEGQTSATEEITATLEEITANAQVMADVAKIQ